STCRRCSRTAWRTPARNRCGCSGSSTRRVVPRPSRSREAPGVLAIVLALASAIGYGGSDFAAGLASRSAPVIQLTLLAPVIGGVIVAAALLFIGLDRAGSGSGMWPVAAAAAGELAAAL